MRQARSLPIVNQLHGKLLSWSADLLPKNPMRQAIGYLLNQWPTLLVFAGDGAVEHRPGTRGAPGACTDDVGETAERPRSGPAA